MQQRSDHKYRHLFPFMFPIVCLVLFLASCGTPQTGGTTLPTGSQNPATSPSTGQQLPIPTNAPPLSAIKGTLTFNLEHNPVGKASLSWNPATKILQVTLSLTGLAPNSTHPAHIHLGSCEQSPNGQRVYSLTNVKADGQGNVTKATATTKINGVANGIPSTGWFVNVHNGPTLSTELQMRWLACGNISSVQTGPSGVQAAQANLGPTISADENVRGSVALSLQGDQLKVVLQLRGLVAGGTPHMAHIHVGRCNAQGTVLVPLNMVTVDGQGNGTSTTLISLTSLPTTTVGPFYINVHEGQMPQNANQPIPQEAFNPIACGNVPLP
jgi:hypothetical protein